MDEGLVDALGRASGGRLVYDDAEQRLTHRRPDGGTTPVFATAHAIRSLMQLLVLLDPRPRTEGEVTIDHATRLLLDHLDQHPVRAVLGVAHLRRAAMGERDVAAAFGGVHRPRTPDGRERAHRSLCSHA